MCDLEKLHALLFVRQGAPTTLSRRQHNMLLQQYAAGAFALAHTRAYMYSPLLHVLCTARPTLLFNLLLERRAVCDADFIERVLSELLIIKQCRPTRERMWLLDFLNDPHRPHTSQQRVGVLSRHH